MNDDRQTALNLNAQINNLCNDIDRWYRELEQTDPPLDSAYLNSLPQKINQNYGLVAQLAVSMTTLKGITVPKPMDSSAMTDAGIIPDTTVSAQ